MTTPSPLCSRNNGFMVTCSTQIPSSINTAQHTTQRSPHNFRDHEGDSIFDLQRSTENVARSVKRTEDIFQPVHESIYSRGKILPATSQNIHQLYPSSKILAVIDSSNVYHSVPLVTHLRAHGLFTPPVM
eukprot:GHVQ01013555.1.p2 GENE.GHVQ01013555.1~~GHVQ01013555.1.p2  ORF type:complete len:130 (-),score=14.14 GHVQ01013555.1:1296-1685(-)